MFSLTMIRNMEMPGLFAPWTPTPSLSLPFGSSNIATSARQPSSYATLPDRMKNRLQISTDGLSVYVDAIERGFGRDVDYGQIIKTYKAERSIEAHRRYSAAENQKQSKRKLSSGVPILT